MAHFKSIDPNAEVSGDAVQAFLKAFPGGSGAVAHRLLSRHGLDNPETGNWYPLQSYLDVLKEVHDTLNDQVLLVIGKHVAANVKLGSNMDRLDHFVMHLDDYHQNVHRGGDVGHLTCTDLGVVNGMRMVQVVSNTPYACSFERGLLEGFAEHFRSQVSTDVLIRREESEPCRQRGADSCTYIIEWQ